MRNGYKIFDANTHLQPSVETLQPYFDRDLRERLPIEKYKTPIKIGRAGEMLEPPDTGISCASAAQRAGARPSRACSARRRRARGRSATSSSSWAAAFRRRVEATTAPRPDSVTWTKRV